MTQHVVCVSYVQTLIALKSTHKYKFYMQLDGCIAWNVHNTVLGSKRLAICATVQVGVSKDNKCSIAIRRIAAVDGWFSVIRQVMATCPS